MTVSTADFQKGTAPEEIQGDMNLKLWVDATGLNSVVIAI
jgi:hypothetical protein